MKILQIAPPWIHIPPEGYGGTELVISNLTENLVKQGHDVTLFATGKSKTKAKLKYIYGQSLLEQNIPWTNALPILLHYDTAFKLAPQFDIVHAHLSSDADLALLPFLAKLEVPHLLTNHSTFPYDKINNIDTLYIKHYANKISIASISRAMRKVLPKGFNDAGVLYNGIDTTKYNYNPKSGEYFTWLGRIKAIKGTKEAILAAKEIGAKLVFAGVVDKNLPKEVEYFEKEIKPLIDGKQIIFLGEADMKVKNEMLSNAKAFLNPIDWEEPFGMVMAESMATGTPVISYARGAAKELITDNQTGYLVNNFKQMKEKMAQVESIDRSACRKRVEKYFSAEAMTASYLKTYKSEIAYQKSVRLTGIPARGIMETQVRSAQLLVDVMGKLDRNRLLSK